MNYKIITPDRREYGPISAAEVRAWAAAGRVNAFCLVQAEGSDEWRPLSLEAEFQDLFRTPPSLQQPALTTAAAPPPPTPSSSMAVAGLVMGLLSVTVGWCCCSMVPFSVLGIVFSGIALARTHRDPRFSQDRAMAMAGLVLSVIAFALGAGGALLVALMEGLSRTRNHHFQFRI